MKYIIISFLLFVGCTQEVKQEPKIELDASMNITKTELGFNVYSNTGELILDVKNKRKKGLLHFAELVLNSISKDIFAVSTMPSSRVGQADNGITMIVKAIAGHTNKIDATSCLYRHTEVPPSHSGGGRNIQKHLDSIRILNLKLISNQDVLLLDDVTTTGASLLAGKQLLIAAGAKNVQCLALAQTQSVY